MALKVAGNSISAQTLEGDKLKQQSVSTSRLAAARGPVEVEVSADPPLPGVSYVVAIDGAVPWPAPSSDAGLALQLDLPTLVMGRVAELTLRATAPDGVALRIEQALPAGIDVVRASLERMEEDGLIISFELHESSVVLNATDREQGTAFVGKLKVIPTLAGTLHSPPSSTQVEGDDATRLYLAPREWRVVQR